MTRTVTLQDQLDNKANWVKDGQLYLLRCVRCDRENWAHAVANGYCAWCLWKATESKETNKPGSRDE